MESNRPFRGIIPPLVTPLTDRDTLDDMGLARLVEHVIAGGSSGLFILGTTGEGPSLSYRLRCELIGRTCELVAGRVPVLVGVTDTSFVESVNLAEIAHDAGADALVLTTPYYFPAGQTELITYVESIMEQFPLPVMLYNMPGMTKVWFEIETLQTLSAIKNIIGIKDSSGDIDYFKRLMDLRHKRPDWSILMGPEHLLADAVRLGGDGGVCGGANVFPALFVSCYEAAVASDDTRLQKLQQLIGSFHRVYDIGKYVSRHIKATKCSLSLLGICDDFMAEPFHRFRSPDRERVREVLQSCVEAAKGEPAILSDLITVGLD